MRYISLFSGVEAATVAWEPLGWEAVAFAEIDDFPSAVLAHRFPEVPNLGDVTKVDWSVYRGEIDVVVGGSPCQSFSIAGNREGLAGESGLMFEYIRAVREIMPRYFVWENVPGALSCEGGEAFGQLLREMDELGYGLAWAVLDAQFFGVAARRERVFLVGSLGDQSASEALFESESLRWDNPSSRSKREELTAQAAGGSGDCFTLQVRCGCEGGGKGALVQEDLSATLACRNIQTVFQPIVIDRASFNQGVNAKFTPHIEEEDVMVPLVARSPHAVMCADEDAGYAVRRLTPREYERLQGFPDDWTKIPFNGKPAEKCPDGYRYKAMGNSMAVPVIRWIGERLEEVANRG